MIPTDASTGHPFTPEWLKDKEKAPRYFLRGATTIERGLLEAELSGEYDAGRVSTIELAVAFRSGLMSLLADDPELDTLLDLIQQEIEGKTLGEEDRQLLIGARTIIKRHWPAYRELVGQLERRQEIAPLLVFARFCIGWENVDAEWSLGKDKKIPEATLAKIDPNQMIHAGLFGYGLLYSVVNDQTFPQPSQSDADLSTSKSDMSRADGSSTASNGTETLD